MGFNPRIKNLDGAIIQLSGSVITGTIAQLTTITASAINATNIAGPFIDSLVTSSQVTASQFVSSFKTVNSSVYTLTASTDEVLVFTGSAEIQIGTGSLPNANSLKKISIANRNSSTITINYPRSVYDNSQLLEQGSGSVTYLKGGTAAPAGDAFGTSVAINDLGDRCVVSAIGTTNGEVYAFVSSSSGWLQHPRITASDGAAGDNFGREVAMNAAGDRIVVGASQADISTLTDCGKAYIYVSSSTGWTQQGAGGNVYISASDKAAGDVFGCRVFMNASGSRIVVAARLAVPGGITDAGKVYIYASGTSGWVQQGAGGNPFISASDKAANDNFGESVAMNAAGDRIVVGADLSNPGGTTDAGKAYVYVSQSTGWIQQGAGGNPFISASDKAASAYFGKSVSMNDTGNRIAIGAPTYNSVYIYDSGSTGWTEQKIISGGPTSGPGVKAENFGGRISLNSAGDRIAIGAYLSDPASLTDAGKMFIFVSTSQGWNDTGTQITSSDIAAGDQFGFDVAMNAVGDRVVVGANLADYSALADAGKAYVYQFNTSSLPYFTGAYDTWPNGFTAYNFNNTINTITTSSTKQNITLISDGTGSWWAI